MSTVINTTLNVTILVFGLISLLVSAIFIVVVGIQLLLSKNVLANGAQKISKGLMLTLCKLVVSNGNAFLLNSFNEVHSYICKPVKVHRCLSGMSGDPGPGPPPSTMIPQNCDSAYPSVPEYTFFNTGTEPSTLAAFPTATFPSVPNWSAVKNINQPSD